MSTNTNVNGLDVLSDVIVFSKYARYIPEEKRRETYEEIVDRNKAMHLRKFPNLKEIIDEVYKDVYSKKVLPSMRSMQFAGAPIERNNARIFNCCYLPITDPTAFSEIMFLLLSGCGVGFSVRQNHIANFPTFKGFDSDSFEEFTPEDSIEGWADCIKFLMSCAFTTGKSPAFNLSVIRRKGHRIVTGGGKAPGPEPLRVCLDTCIDYLNENVKKGDKPRAIHLHDLCCIISDAVLAGGIRRSALISLFSKEDEEMMTCKTGNWWDKHGYRARANNSFCANPNEVTLKDFEDALNHAIVGGYGEPAAYLTNSSDSGTNP